MFQSKLHWEEQIRMEHVPNKTSPFPLRESALGNLVKTRSNCNVRSSSTVSPPLAKLCMAGRELDGKRSRRKPNYSRCTCKYLHATRKKSANPVFFCIGAIGATSGNKQISAFKNHVEMRTYSTTMCSKIFHCTGEARVARS